MPAVLAIDQGTSGTKAVVVDHLDQVVASVELALRPTYLPGGGVEQDPELLLASVLDAGRRAVAEAGVPVAAVAIANQGETVLAWDPSTGRPLSAAVVWQDRRSEALCSGWSDQAEVIAARTGLVLDPYFSAPKMAWLRQEVTGEGVVTTTDTWLVHQLTGRFVTDVSTASRSLLLDVDSVSWDRELLELFGLADERLPELLASDEIVGPTDQFGPPMLVAGLIVDQQAALLAERCWDPGALKCTFGTGAFVLANAGERAVRSSAGLTTSVAWRVRGETRYCLDGQVYTAASAVRWLQGLGLLGDVSELDSVAGEEAGGVMCVPALAGLAAPWWRPDATASFTGMTLSSGPGNLVRAVLEGIAAQVAELTDLVGSDLGVSPGPLRVDGGLTRSKVLMQATADLTRLDVDVYPSHHATALGAAALARLATEPGLGLRDAVTTWAPTTTYRPVWSSDRAAEFRHRWRAIAAASSDGAGETAR